MLRLSSLYCRGLYSGQRSFLPLSFKMSLRGIHEGKGVDGVESPSEAPHRSKVYTRTGDKGTSSLFSGQRRSKDDEVFEALGVCDELNSYVGLAREHCTDIVRDTSVRLEEIQCMLQEVGSAVATPQGTGPAIRAKQTKFNENYVVGLESWIDSMDESLPPLTQFILPSGGLCATQLHVARTVCRRLERRLVPLVRAGEVDQSVGVFVNRLSDALFTAARYVARKQGNPETCYRAVQGKTVSDQ